MVALIFQLLSISNLLKIVVKNILKAMFTLPSYSFMCTKKSFDGCGTTMGCVKGLKCTTPENCEALAKYYYNNATQMMHFSVTFKNYAWVALAQNTIDKPEMVKYSYFLLSFYSLYIIFLLS